MSAIPTRATCFEKNGLEINGIVDSSDPIRLGSGVCSFTGKGSGYNTDECYWQVTKYNDVTHDGIREIQFDAVCYIPDSSIPYFGQTTTIITRCTGTTTLTTSSSSSLPTGT